MKTDNGGPAFPVPDIRRPGEYIMGSYGISARDYFAAKAMQAYLIAAQGNAPEPEQTADEAYFMADAMLEARKK